jgi:YHS domain-containing protein
MAIDPVCDMTVDERHAASRSEYQGKTYYFCAPGCKRQFDRDPQRYIATQSTQGGEREKPDTDQ